MAAAHEAPTLPPELQPLYDASAAAQQTFDRYAAGDVTSTMREPVLPTNDREAAYAQVVPRTGKPDPAQHAVMGLPISRRLDPGIKQMAEIVHSLVVPDGTLTVFPNNDRVSNAYSLQRPEKARVANGDYSPIADKQHEVLDHLGIEAVRLVVARSQGAAVGAAFGRRAGHYGRQLQAMALDEAPNTYRHGRHMAALRWAVLRETPYAIEALKQTGVDSFEIASLVDNAEHLKQYKREGFNMLRSNILTHPNPEICRGFTHDSFFDDVAETLAGNPMATAFISNARSSRVGSIVDTENFVAEQNSGVNAGRLGYLKYQGWHVTAGNPFVLGMLGQMGLHLNETHRIAQADAQSRDVSLR